MNIAEACEFVQTKAASQGIGILELLIDMRQAPEDYTAQELAAYRVFMADAQRMFAPAEA